MRHVGGDELHADRNPLAAPVQRQGDGGLTRHVVLPGEGGQAQRLVAAAGVGQVQRAQAPGFDPALLEPERQRGQRRRHQDIETARPPLGHPAGVAVLFGHGLHQLDAAHPARRSRRAPGIRFHVASAELPAQQRAEASEFAGHVRVLDQVHRFDHRAIDQRVETGRAVALHFTRRFTFELPGSARRSDENHVGKVGTDAIRVAGGQGPPHELSVCTDEEVRKRHQRCDSPGLLSAPLAVAAIRGGTSDRGLRGKVDDLHAPRPYPPGCQLRLLVADTNLGDAYGIRSGTVPDHTFGDRRCRPCVKR